MNEERRQSVNLCNALTTKSQDDKGSKSTSTTVQCARIKLTFFSGKTKFQLFTFFNGSPKICWTSFSSRDWQFFFFDGKEYSHECERPILSRLDAKMYGFEADLSVRLQLVS